MAGTLRGRGEGGFVGWVGDGGWLRYLDTWKGRGRVAKGRGKGGTWKLLTAATNFGSLADMGKWEYFTALQGRGEEAGTVAEPVDAIGSRLVSSP